MAPQMLAIKRRGHRRGTPPAIEVAHFFPLRNRRSKQPDLGLMAVYLLQTRECLRLRLYKYTAQLVSQNQLAQVVVSFAIKRADLEEPHLLVPRQLMGHHKRQQAANQKVRPAGHERRRVTALNPQAAKDFISPAPSSVGA
jgi:hypothetical protein